MKVIAFASYPVEAAATRYRLHQFIGALNERGITLAIYPFLDAKLFASIYKREALPATALGLLKATLLRLKDVLAARGADVILVQREAMLFGPPIIEWLAKRFSGRPMVLDLDDATYLPYSSPTYGKLGKSLKWFSKTDDLIRWASVVICGNRAIAEYVASKGVKASIIPTVVDTDIFRPAERDKANDKLVLGWIGTHSTYPYLESIFPVLRQLSTRRAFRLKIVGSGRKDITVPGVEVENLQWQLNREVQDFQSFDIGLYPIVSKLYADEWAMGKSGFKAIQYMSVGIPFVASPVGAITEIGQAGRTHLIASTNEEWLKALVDLIDDAEKRKDLGTAGRAEAINHYGLAAQADKLAAVFRQAAEGS